MTIYLDNAASTCPKPEEVIQAVDDCLRSACANPGRGAHKAAVAAARIIFGTRQKAAALLGINDSADLVFTQNATDSLNLALHGYLRSGDHVVTSPVEHNAVLRPLKSMAARGVRITFTAADAAGRVSADDVLGALEPGTRLVVLSHASNVTGAILPVAEIAARLAERGVPLLVDAAQSAGSLPLKMAELPVGMLACTGHKGLLGPQGTGLLYIAPEIDLMTVRQGGTGTNAESEQDALGRPDRYESGTYNTPGIAGLGAAIDFLAAAGVQNLASHKAALTARLHEALAKMTGVTVYGPGLGEPRAPLVSFNIAGMTSAEAAARLDRDYDIASRAGLHCAPGAHRLMGTLKTGAVRLSIGPFNTEDEIEEAAAAVRALVSRQP